MSSILRCLFFYTDYCIAYAVVNNYVGDKVISIQSPKELSKKPGENETNEEEYFIKRKYSKHAPEICFEMNNEFRIVLFPSYTEKHGVKTLCKQMPDIVIDTNPLHLEAYALTYYCK